MNTTSKQHGNHIFLTSGAGYERNLVKLCERLTQRGKYVLVITLRCTSLSTLLCKDRDEPVMQVEGLSVLTLSDIESAPRLIVELFKYLPKPDLIVFDLHSIIVHLLSWPVLKQLDTESLVRHIAKCAAAFCNLKEMVHQNKKHQLTINDMKATRIDLMDTIIVLPTDSYPLTPGQFKLLIGLYFCGSECYTDFGEVAARINASQG